MALSIVHITSVGLKVLKEIGIRTYEDHYTDIWKPQGLANYLEEQFGTNKLEQDLSNNKVQYFIAYEDELPHGFLKLKPGRPMPNDSMESGLELEKIYLLKEATGEGYGGKMMAFVMDHARDLGEKLVWLDVLKNNDHAVRFYQRHGFAIVDEVEFSTDKMKIDMWVMKRDL